MSESYKNNIVKRKCIKCNFEFFTHYTDRDTCNTCIDNDNTKDVRDWSN